MLNRQIYIRKFKSEDRRAVRRISCETAFLGELSGVFFDDNEILSDILTLYFTDFEPDSCFVAVDAKRVIGYIIGSKNAKKMNNVFIKKILPQLINRSLRKGLFLRPNNLRFFLRIAASFLKGEFFAPDFSKSYPATLHINIDKDYRGEKLGEQLIARYLVFLGSESVSGVHFGTMSEGAKKFFLKVGFSILHKSKRSYMRYYLKQDVPYYVFGKILQKEMI